MAWFKENYVIEPFSRGLSLGCGEGALERDVMEKRICCEMLGLDLSNEAVTRASALARAAGLDSINYRLGDMNHLELEEESFDIGFFHQSLHHVEALDSCLATVRRALRPDALLYLDEYIGPSRGDWCRELIAEAQEVYARLPRQIKRRRRVTLPVDWRDPSEAVRSAEIVEHLERYFVLRERRDYGGNLLSVIHPLLKPDVLTTPLGEEVLATLVAAEDRLLERGVGSYYAVLVAEPR
jgi:SAM-dependent methyltransferase